MILKIETYIHTAGNLETVSLMSKIFSHKILIQIQCMFALFQINRKCNGTYRSINNTFL